MADLYVYVYVSESVALASRKAEAGNFQVLLTEEWLSSLSDEEMSVLKPHVAQQKERYQPNALNVTAPNLDAVKVALEDALENQRKEIAKQQRKIEAWVAKPDSALIEQRTRAPLSIEFVYALPDLWRNENVPGALELRKRAYAVRDKAIAEVRENLLAEFSRGPDRDLIYQHSYNGNFYIRDIVKDIGDPELKQRATRACEAADAAYEAKEKAEEERRKKERAEWIEKHGTPSQRARESEGLLPEGELKAAMRDWIFREFEGLERYERLRSSDALHDEECYEDCRVEFNVDEAESITEGAFVTLCDVRDTCKASAFEFEITPRVHSCEPACSDDVVRRFSVLVSVEYAGLPFSREFAL